MSRMDGHPACISGGIAKATPRARCYGFGIPRVGLCLHVPQIDLRLSDDWLCLAHSQPTMKMSNKRKKKISPDILPAHFTLSYTNIRGLRSNINSVQSFLIQNSPDVLAMCETNLNPGISSSDFSVDGYLPLIRKDSDSHMHGLAVYARSNLPLARECTLESPNHPYMCFRLSLLHSTSYLFFLYRSPSSYDCTVIDVVSDNIDKALSSCPSANIIVFGDFNAHHDTWSNASDAAGIQTL